MKRKAVIIQYSSKQNTVIDHNKVKKNRISYTLAKQNAAIVKNQIKNKIIKALIKSTKI